jgi:nitroreductase
LLTARMVVSKRLDISRPVERPFIEDRLHIALQTPSASNMQSWHFFGAICIVSDEAV